jgi:hypothetical protein
VANTVTIDKALFAHFNQPSGPSKPGAMWAVRVAGEQSGIVMVRTLFSCNSPTEAEKKEKSDKAIQFVVQKLEQGLKLQPGKDYFELTD